MTKVDVGKYGNSYRCRDINRVMDASPIVDADTVLWRRTVAGDPDAFAELYRRHGRTIYNYLFRRLGDWSDAEDLTASVFLVAFSRRHEVAVAEGKVVAWLFGIATHLANNRRRSRRRHEHVLHRVAAASTSRADDACARAEARDQMRLILERTRALPKEQQDVLALCLWSGLSYEDAAFALAVPVGTVRSRLARARAALTELQDDARHEVPGPQRRKVTQ